MSGNSPSPVLQTDGLRKEFGHKTAVADLTLRVEAGEIFGFLGPNGAGKTTSIKMLLGLIRPTAGEGWLLGQSLGDAAARRKVGFLPEHFRFHEWLTAGEFLDLHGRLYGMSRAARRQAVGLRLGQVGLADRVDAPLRTFSKGMLQRIGLAQALLNDPLVVFLDEPTSGLDPIGRRLVRDLIHQLRDQGTAVFLNSHLLSEVEKTCDRVAFIRNGVIVDTLRLGDAVPQAVALTLRVGQPTAALLAALAGWGEEVRQERDGRIHLNLSAEAELPRLAGWLVAEGHTLYELTPQRQSLEDRFMQIINEDDEVRR